MHNLGRVENVQLEGEVGLQQSSRCLDQRSHTLTGPVHSMIAT